MPQHKTDKSKLPITLAPVKATPERVIRLVQPEGSCTECGRPLIAAGGDGGSPPRTFYPRGPNGGFIVEHRLWNGKLHPIEWHFAWEHPDTGEFYAAMPAKLVLDVTDMSAILGVRPSWIFARSARWKSRLAMYEIRVRTFDWMLEIYYDAANLAQQERDSFQDANYSRIRAETRAERRIKVRLGHVLAGCPDPATCKKSHKPPRPRDRRR